MEKPLKGTHLEMLSDFGADGIFLTLLQVLEYQLQGYCTLLPTMDTFQGARDLMHLRTSESKVEHYKITVPVREELM